MAMTSVRVGTFDMGNDLPLTVIGGLNVLEDYDLAARTCEHFMQVCADLGLNYVFKASFDKANRSSLHSFRGPGLEAGMKIFDLLKANFHVPIITDVHEPYQCEQVAPHVDILQLPAFLARQTDLVHAMARTGKVINVKKPQFMAPAQVANIMEKFAEGGNEQVILSQGLNPATLKLIGVGLSNGLIALSGALLAQYQGFADANLGQGMVVQGLAAVMIGEFLFSSNKISLITLRCILGGIIYKGLMFLGRKYGYLVGITPNDFKLLTGILVIISLTVAKTRALASDKGARKKAIERTMAHMKEEGNA